MRAELSLEESWQKSLEMPAKMWGNEMVEWQAHQATAKRMYEAAQKQVEEAKLRGDQAPEDAVKRIEAYAEVKNMAKVVHATWKSQVEREAGGAARKVQALQSAIEAQRARGEDTSNAEKDLKTAEEQAHKQYGALIQEKEVEAAAWKQLGKPELQAKTLAGASRYYKAVGDVEIEAGKGPKREAHAPGEVPALEQGKISLAQVDAEHRDENWHLRHAELELSNGDAGEKYLQSARGDTRDATTSMIASRRTAAKDLEVADQKVSARDENGLTPEQLAAKAEIKTLKPRAEALVARDLGRLERDELLAAANGLGDQPPPGVSSVEEAQRQLDLAKLRKQDWDGEWTHLTESNQMQGEVLAAGVALKEKELELAKAVHEGVDPLEVKRLQSEVARSELALVETSRRQVGIQGLVEPAIGAGEGTVAARANAEIDLAQAEKRADAALSDYLKAVIDQTDPDARAKRAALDDARDVQRTLRESDPETPAESAAWLAKAGASAEAARTWAEGSRGLDPVQRGAVFSGVAEAQRTVIDTRVERRDALEIAQRHEARAAKRADEEIPGLEARKQQLEDEIEVGETADEVLAASVGALSPLDPPSETMGLAQWLFDTDTARKELDFTNASLNETFERFRTANRNLGRYQGEHKRLSADLAESVQSLELTAGSYDANIDRLPGANRDAARLTSVSLHSSLALDAAAAKMPAVALDSLDTGKELKSEIADPDVRALASTTLGAAALGTAETLTAKAAGREAIANAWTRADALAGDGKEDARRAPLATPKIEARVGETLKQISALEQAIERRREKQAEFFAAQAARVDRAAEIAQERLQYSYNGAIATSHEVAGAAYSILQAPEAVGLFLNEERFDQSLEIGLSQREIHGELAALEQTHDRALAEEGPGGADAEFAMMLSGLRSGSGLGARDPYFTDAAAVGIQDVQGMIDFAAEHEGLPPGMRAAAEHFDPFRQAVEADRKKLQLVQAGIDVALTAVAPEAAVGGSSAMAANIATRGLHLLQKSRTLAGFVNVAGEARALATLKFAAQVGQSYGAVKVQEGVGRLGASVFGEGSTGAKAAGLFGQVMTIGVATPGGKLARLNVGAADLALRQGVIGNMRDPHLQHGAESALNAAMIAAPALTGLSGKSAGQTGEAAPAPGAAPRPAAGIDLTSLIERTGGSKVMKTDKIPTGHPLFITEDGKRYDLRFGTSDVKTTAGTVEYLAQKGGYTVVDTGSMTPKQVTALEARLSKNGLRDRAILTNGFDSHVNGLARKHNVAPEEARSLQETLRRTGPDAKVVAVGEREIASHFGVSSRTRGVKLPEHLVQAPDGKFHAAELKNMADPDVDHAVEKFTEIAQRIEGRHGKGAVGGFELHVREGVELGEYSTNSQGTLMRGGAVVTAGGHPIRVVALDLPPTDGTIGKSGHVFGGKPGGGAAAGPGAGNGASTPAETSAVVVKRPVLDSQGQQVRRNGVYEFREQHGFVLESADAASGTAVVRNAKGQREVVPLDSVAHAHNGVTLGANTPHQQIKFNEAYRRLSPEARTELAEIMGQARQKSPEHAVLLNRQLGSGRTVAAVRALFERVRDVPQSELAKMIAMEGATQHYTHSCAATSGQVALGWLDAGMAMAVTSKPKAAAVQQARRLQEAGGGGRPRTDADYRGAADLAPETWIPAQPGTADKRALDAANPLYRRGLVGHRIYNSNSLDAQSFVPQALDLVSRGHEVVVTLRPEGSARDRRVRLTGAYGQGASRYVTVDPPNAVGATAYLHVQGGKLHLQGLPVSSVMVPKGETLRAASRGMFITDSPVFQSDLKEASGKSYERHGMARAGAGARAALTRKAKAEIEYGRPVFLEVQWPDGTTHQLAIKERSRLSPENGQREFFLFDPTHTKGRWLPWSGIENYWDGTPGSARGRLVALILPES